MAEPHVPKSCESPRLSNLHGMFLLILLLLYGEAEAAHKVAHCRPLPADAAFPSDFPALQDQEWGYRLGGWGGLPKGRPVRRRPVIFIHGNTRDATDWDEPGRSVKKRFLDAGYSPQELWAISYSGKSTKDRPPGSQCVTDNRTNIPDLAAFVKGVLAIYDGTGADILYLPWLLGWPVRDQDSPALKGAQNVKMPGLTHDELRTSDDAVSAYLRFVN